MSAQPSITFVTGVGTVTGANFLLETAGGSKILVDCGLVQGEKVALDENREPFPYDLSSIDALIVTHAHLDHVGRIPKLVREGYSGPIYSTPQTRSLAELVMNDAANILAMESRQEGREPLYVLEDVAPALALWKTIPYHEQFKLTDDVSIFLKDAGHILGSSMVEASVGMTADQGSILKILFTGDVGNSPAPLLRDTEPVGDVDFMVMESVYGDRNHEDREQRSELFQKIITDTIARGGTLVIPAFSIDRTQVLLYELNNFVKQGMIPSVPVFVDSPMATKATEVYESNTELFNDAAQAQIRKGDDLFSFPHLQFTSSADQSGGIDRMKGAKIILAGSGMSVGGRVISHEEYFLPDPKNTILLVGYQSAGSLGRELADGARKVNIHGRKVSVGARIETIYGFSAHKDGDHLVGLVETASDRLKKVFVVMGEPKSSMHLAQRINDELKVKALMPERNVPYPLEL